MNMQCKDKVGIRQPLPFCLDKTKRLLCQSKMDRHPLKK